MKILLSEETAKGAPVDDALQKIILDAQKTNSSLNDLLIILNQEIP